MHCLIISIGSMGDTFPFISLGKAMRARGHEVTLVANGHFREQVEKAGLNFLETLSSAQYQDFLQAQNQRRQLDALRHMADDLLSQLRNVYQIVTERYVPGETVVAAQGYAFGARIAQEKVCVPLATVHLQPMWFRSIYDPPSVPDWFPRWYPGMFDRLIDFFIDRRVGAETNAFRARTGFATRAACDEVLVELAATGRGLFPRVV